MEKDPTYIFHGGFYNISNFTHKYLWIFMGFDEPYLSKEPGTGLALSQSFVAWVPVRGECWYLKISGASDVAPVSLNFLK